MNVQYSTVQYCTVQYSTVQYSTVLYSTVQYSAGIYTRTCPVEGYDNFSLNARTALSVLHPR